MLCSISIGRVKTTSKEYGELWGNRPSLPQQQLLSKDIKSKGVEQTLLELEPTPPQTRNNQCQTEYWRVRQQCFVRWDIFQMQSKVFSSRHFFYLFQLLIHQRTPTTVIFPGCSESHVVHPHMHSCVSDRGEKGAQSLILSLGLKGIDITFKVDP